MGSKLASLIRRAFTASTVGQNDSVTLISPTRGDMLAPRISIAARIIQQCLHSIRYAASRSSVIDAVKQRNLLFLPDSANLLPVPNGTEWPRSPGHHGCMSKKKARKDYGKATLASVKKEMGKPRVAKSARKKHANLALTAVLREARKSSSREAAERYFEGRLFQE